MLVLFRTLYTHQCVSMCIFIIIIYPQNLVAGNKIITNVLANRKRCCLYMIIIHELLNQ